MKPEILTLSPSAATVSQEGSMIAIIRTIRSRGLASTWELRALLAAIVAVTVGVVVLVGIHLSQAMTPETCLASPSADGATSDTTTSATC